MSKKPKNTDFEGLGMGEYFAFAGCGYIKYSDKGLQRNATEIASGRKCIFSLATEVRRLYLRDE